MREEPSPRELAALATGQVAGAATTDATVAFGRLQLLARRRAQAGRRSVLRPSIGVVGLAALIVGALAVVLFSSARESVLVSNSPTAFPSWLAGPLHGLVGGLPNKTNTLDVGFTAVLLGMLAAYGLVLATVRALPERLIWASVVVLVAIMTLGPPLQLNDVFNYLGYARLGGLHHLNPYTHVIAVEHHDPVFRLTSWRYLTSPYGELFTALTYPLAWLSLPVAFWVLKISTSLAALAFLWMVAVCARKLGRDPRFAVAFVALNPIFVIWAVGGFHNDFFMLLPATAAIALLLDGRDRPAGAALVLAVGIKFTAALLLPFLLLAAGDRVRRLRLLEGAALAAVPLIALSLALFGFSLPNLHQQSTLLTPYSIANLVGVGLGLGGGTPGLLRVASVLVVVVIGYLLWRRKDWLSSAGWATLALIASLSWLMPWYALWLLPLAALGTSVRLRRASLVLVLFLVLVYAPESWVFQKRHGIDLLRGAAGKASLKLQQQLTLGR